MSDYCTPAEARQLAAAPSFAALAPIIISILSRMGQPLALVFAPMKSGGFGPEENMRRFKQALSILERKGYIVFDQAFDELQGAIERIIGEMRSRGEIGEKDYPIDQLIAQLHVPLFCSGYIKIAFFLSGWPSSQGCRLERQALEAISGIELPDFPESWFDEY